MIGFFWRIGIGALRRSRRQHVRRVERTEKTALELLEEIYFHGEISRDEYLQKREDPRKR